MKSLLLILALLIPSAALAQDAHPEWTNPRAPFQIADNLYYVGSEDLAVYLITTPAGNILINANLQTSPPQIRASIEKLGFKYLDTKILLNSQAHFDHIGGLAQIQRETHAQNMVMEGDAEVASTGGHSDFLAGTGSVEFFPPSHVDRVLHDRDTVTLGGVTLTAHRTAGHTRGCPTWTLQVHVPGEPANQRRNVVIVGGYSFWSDFHFVATPHHPVSYPGIAADFAQTFRTLRALPCDLFLGAHGSYFDMEGKLARFPAAGPKVFIDPTGYQHAIDRAEAKFTAELRRQQAAAKL